MKSLDKFLESRFHDEVPTLGDIIHHWSHDWAGLDGMTAKDLRTTVIDGLQRIERQIGDEAAGDETHDRTWDWA